MDVTSADTHRAIDAVWRIESPKLIAGLARIVRDIGVAEDLAQDALVAALEQWPESGIPRNPGAWLMTTARRRAVDRLRRQARYRERMQQLTAEASAMDRSEPTGGPMGADDRLPLLFTCCHPALSREAQVALTLRTVGGLETVAVARAFLVPEATIAQRLFRAKRKIRAAGIPLDLYGPGAGNRLRFWRNRRLSSATIADLYRSHLVGLNLPQPGNTERGLNLRAFEIPAAGGIGFWTKADAATAFDDLRISDLPSGGAR